MAVFRLGRIHGSGLPRLRAANSSRPGTTRTDYRPPQLRAVMFDLERSMLVIAQASAVLVSRTEPGQHHIGSSCRLLFRHSPRRASRTTRLSAPEHHRCVRVLDWKVAHGSGKTEYGYRLPGLQVMGGK